MTEDQYIAQINAEVNKKIDRLNAFAQQRLTTETYSESCISFLLHEIARLEFIINDLEKQLSKQTII